MQAIWEYQTTGLKHLQLILPLSSLPMIENTKEEYSVQEYMLEIVCVVTDMNIFPLSNT